MYAIKHNNGYAPQCYIQGQLFATEDAAANYAKTLSQKTKESYVAVLVSPEFADMLRDSIDD